MRWAGRVEWVGEGIDSYRVLVGKPEGRRTHGRPRHTRRLMLKWICRNWVGTTDWIVLV